MKIFSDVSRARRPAQPRRASDLQPDEDICAVDVIHLGAVRHAKGSLPRDEVVSRTADLLGLLGNATRLKILLALRGRGENPPRELCVCDLAVVAGASKSLTSHQLRLLRTAGLVVVRRAGKLAYYRLAQGAAGELLGRALDVASAQGVRYRNGPR